ncbi:hypothetical protein THIOSC15_150035 [uncultured Thiomicrorhabdus sp.]
MARQAVKCGITHTVCTPHIHYGRYNNDLETISQALAIFKQGLRENKIPLKVAAVLKCA